MNKDKRRKRRHLIELVIIILLLLITSCSAFKHFGKLGSNNLEIDEKIKDETNDKIKNINDLLRYDIDYKNPLKIDINSKQFKISFSYKNIIPNEFTCTSTNYEVATCLVSNGYIKILPKKIGKTKINLVTEINGVKYIASVNIQVVNSSKTNQSTKINHEKASTKYSSTLKSLTVLGYNLTPQFNSKIYKYYVEVPYSVKELSVNAIPTSSKSVVSIVGSKNLKVGNNEITVKVTALNGSTSTYTIVVNRLNEPQKELSSNSYLKSLTIENHEINFNKDIHSYNITVDGTVTNLNIEALPEVDSSRVEILGNENFVIGTNIVTIKVTAEDGTISTYNIVVNKEADRTNTLASLSVKDFTISPAFTPDNLEYTLTVPYNINKIDVLYEKASGTEAVEVVGNTNLIQGSENIVSVNVTSQAGTVKTYKIKVTREADTSDYYINTNLSYQLGFRAEEDNSKNIVLDTNIFENTVTSTYENNILTLTDGANTITLESSMNLQYVEGDNSTYVIKVTYDSTGSKTIAIEAKKGNQLIRDFNVTFNIKNIFFVTLDANGGFYNEFSSKYNFTFYADEQLDLSLYKDAYKITETDNCLQYKALVYNTKSDGTGTNYSFETININSDLNLYVIYDTTNTTRYINSNHRLYLDDVDIFKLEDGTKGFIYPGAQGSYVMHIENTTTSKITLKKLILEEDNICISNNRCLNMGYIVKYYNNNNYHYPLGGVNNYSILNINPLTHVSNGDGTYHNTVEVNLEGIELNPGETSEVSLLWKWVDSNSDTEIGDYVAENSIDTYYLTVSYVFDKEDTSCEV